MLVVNKMLAVLLTAAFITSSAAEFGDKIISDDVTYTTAANTDIPVQNGNNAQLTSFKDISTGFNFKSHDDTTSPESTTSLNTHLRHVNRNHGGKISSSHRETNEDTDNKNEPVSNIYENPEPDNDSGKRIPTFRLKTRRRRIKQRQRSSREKNQDNSQSGDSKSGDVGNFKYTEIGSKENKYLTSDETNTQRGASASSQGIHKVLPTVTSSGDGLDNDGSSRYKWRNRNRLSRPYLNLRASPKRETVTQSSASSTLDAPSTIRPTTRLDNFRNIYQKHKGLIERKKHSDSSAGGQVSTERVTKSIPNAGHSSESTFSSYKNQNSNKLLNEFLPTPTSVFTSTQNSTKSPSENNLDETQNSFISPTSHIRNTVFQFGPSFSAIEQKDSDRSWETNNDKLPKSSAYRSTQDLNGCDSTDGDSERLLECKNSNRIVPANILQSTQDIIKLAESGFIIKADDKQISATEAWLPNVLLTTAHPPLAGRYNLYRSDVTPSPHLTDNFRDRRPSDSYQKKSPKTSTSGSDYHKSYRQPEKKPAPVFATFDKFLKTHGIKETGYFNPTIKKEMLPKQSSSAISFQHSYMNSNRSPSPSDFDSIASSSFDRFPTSNIRKQSIREKKHSTDYLSPATTVQSFYFRPPTESELARTQAPNKLYHNDLKVAYSDSHNFVQASEESKKDKQNTLFTNEISSNANSLQNNKIHTAVPLSFSNFNVGSSGHKQYVTSPPTYRQKHVKYPETMRPDISNKNIRSEMAGQSGLKETIIKSPANNQNGDPKTNIATSTHFKAVLLQEDDKRYENQKKSFTPPQPQFHNAGQQFRYPRPMLKMPFITQHNIILTPKPYMQKLLSIPPVYDRMNAIRNPMKITTTGLGGRNIRRPFTREPGSRNSLRLTNTNRKRTVPRTRRNNRKRHVQNGIIRADESRVRNIVAVPPKDNFFRAGQFEIPRDVIFYNDIPNDRKRTNQIFGAQHSATHRNNYFVPKPNSNFIHGRNRPQIVLNSRPPIESLSGSLRNLYVVPSSRTGRRNNVFNSPPPISDYPPDNQLPSTSFQNVVFESQKAPKYDSSNTLPKTRPAKSYSLNRGKFAYPEQNSIHNSRIHSNTYSDDDEKLRGLSQPLPHRALLETSRNKMAESHMSLLKNLQFGINGEPLDVWIPMKSDKAYDKAVAGSEQHLSVSEDRPHEGAPQHLITIPVFDVMADSLDRDYDEYIDRMDEPQALSSTEEDYTVPEYDDDYIELIYHEHEDDEEVPDHEAHEESEHELLPSYDTQEHR